MLVVIARCEFTGDRLVIRCPIKDHALAERQDLLAEILLPGCLALRYIIATRLFEFFQAPVDLLFTQQQINRALIQINAQAITCF